MLERLTVRNNKENTDKNKDLLLACNFLRDLCLRSTIPNTYQD